MTLRFRDQTNRHLFPDSPPEADALSPRKRRALHRGTRSFGALALGAVAIGAMAIGAVAIGRLAIGRARIRRLEIDELVVRRLRVDEAFQAPPKHDAER